MTSKKTKKSKKRKKIIKKILKYLLFFIFSLFFLFSCFLLVGFGKQADNITWGVNFSQKHSQTMGLDWKKNYLAILEDLGAKEIKISSYWDYIEVRPDEYNFNDLDWQIEEAEKRNARILLVIGMKTPRWPECHIPEWAADLSKNEQQGKILKFLENTVLRYKKSAAIWGWQVENEIFFEFGNCPWRDEDFLEKEVALVRSLDSRPIVISDSGEYSLWFKAARIADIIGITMYRNVWFKEIKSYFSYPFPEIFYIRRANLIKNLFYKEVMCVELQAEPWGQKLLYDLPLEEQEKSMNPEQFRKNIDFAKKTEIENFYLWGAEWWYWMKETQNRPEIWNEAKKLF